MNYINQISQTYLSTIEIRENMVNNNQNFIITQKNMQIYRYKHDCTQFVEALCVALDSRVDLPTNLKLDKKMNYFIYIVITIKCLLDL
jgi:hypothetical protein